MRFVIKNYIKTSHGEKLYATFTDIVNKIPLNEFEKYVKEIPNSWFDEDAGIVFSGKFVQGKESEKC